MKHLKSRAIRSVDNEWCTKEMQKECRCGKQRMNSQIFTKIRKCSISKKKSVQESVYISLPYHGAFYRVELLRQFHCKLNYICEPCIWCVYFDPHLPWLKNVVSNL
jgi:hypothetical protein